MATAKRAPSPAPTVFVLFGATGDLAKRMALPAFYRLALETSSSSPLCHAYRPPTRPLC